MWQTTFTRTKMALRRRSDCQSDLQRLFSEELPCGKLHPRGRKWRFDYKTNDYTTILYEEEFHGCFISQQNLTC